MIEFPTAGGLFVAENSLKTSAIIEKHVDQLEMIATTFLAPVLIVLFAAASGTKGFDILGLHLDTENSYGMVVAAFDCLLLLFATTSWKTGDFLKMCEGSEVGGAIAAILTHKWLLNPFSYSGKGVLSALSCGVGAGLLNIIWWVGLCSLQLLPSVSHGRGAVERVFFAFYFVFGMTSALGVIRLIRLILQRMNSTAHSSSAGACVTASDLKLNLALKSVFAATATISGFWLYYAFAHLGI
jgi:hypothetical protein